LFVAKFLIPAYYKARVFTVYGYLEERFGQKSKVLAAILFFIGRSLGSGVRLYGASIALVVVLDMEFHVAIAMIAILAFAYTIVGGIRSVIYTDAIQGVLLFGGGIAALVALVYGSDLGIKEIFAELSSATTIAGTDKLRVFDFQFDWHNGFSFWAGVLGTAFLTTAMMGTDQDMMQRALTCKDAEGGKKSFWLSASLSIPVVVLFLSVGSALWHRVGGDVGAANLAAEIALAAGESNPDKGYDYIFPWFVLHELPIGVKGLIVAGIFAAAMSSLDSAISALSSTAVKSIWQPLFRPNETDKHYLKVGRFFSFGFGVLLSSIAWVVYQSTSSGSAAEGFGVLRLGLEVLTWVFPALLGVFLCGILTKRGSDNGNVFAILITIAAILSSRFCREFFGFEATPFAWTWNSVFGTLMSFAIASSFRGEPQEQRP
jgi:SSS family solute:Na+ symporter